MTLNKQQMWRLKYWYRLFEDVILAAYNLWNFQIHSFHKSLRLFIWIYLTQLPLGISRLYLSSKCLHRKLRREKRSTVRHARKIATSQKTEQIVEHAQPRSMSQWKQIWPNFCSKIIELCHPQSLSWPIEFQKPGAAKNISWKDFFQSRAFSKHQY